MDPNEQIPPRPVARGVTAYWEALRDRATDPRLRVAALLVAAAIAGTLWYQVGQRQASAALPGAPSAAAPTGNGRRPPPRSTTTTRPPVLVHVAGAVVRPGLVRVATGARVADAVQAAGGGLPDADLDRLNLAAKVLDGQRIAVSRIGQAGLAGGSDVGGPAATDASGADATGPVDLNAATAVQLDALPGIGPSLAAAIIRERERRGGFTSVDQLREVRGIGDKRFADLRPLVSV